LHEVASPHLETFKNSLNRWAIRIWLPLGIKA
jgi:hypothetical protein